MPWNLLNYSLALTSIGWRSYFLASAAAVAPWAALFAHLGSLAASLADLLEGEEGGSSSSTSSLAKRDVCLFCEHALLATAAGAALVVAAASYVVFLARRELRQALRAEGGAVGAAALDELAPLEAEVEDGDDDSDGDGDSEGGTEEGGGEDKVKDKDKDIEKGHS